MAEHIRNPFEMIVQEAGTFFGDLERAMAPRARPVAVDKTVVVRRIAASDLKDALRQGWADLGATRADVLFIGLIYAVAGLLIGRVAFNQNMYPLLFPLISGFALVGPVAAVGLYEISRRRELGEPVSWVTGFGVLRSPAVVSIMGLGAILVAVLLLWLLAAAAIYDATLGPEPPTSVASFAGDVLGTPQGWAMIAIGVGVGFLFAVAAFSISAVAFPLLLDRPVGLYPAIGASIRAVRTNLRVMALWGLIVVGLLALASVPALLGLIVVLPLLGHATWHLYRKLIEPAP